MSGMPWAVAGATLAFVGTSIWITVVDFNEFRIPNFASALIAVIGAAVVASVSPEVLGSHILSALSGFVLFWGTGWIMWRRRRVEYLGLGDAKLFAAGLLWVGPWGAASVVLIAASTALLFAALPVLTRNGKIQRKVPFGPFLCIGIYVVWLYGPIGV